MRTPKRGVSDQILDDLHVPVCALVDGNKVR